MENKLVYEVRLSKPLMAVAVVAAFGLLAIGMKPSFTSFSQFNYYSKNCYLR